jgi:hypothetical protein
VVNTNNDGQGSWFHNNNNEAVRPRFLATQTTTLHVGSIAFAEGPEEEKEQWLHLHICAYIIQKMHQKCRDKIGAVQ